MLDFQKLSAQYQQALLRQVVPFWLKFGQDKPYGGYFDLLSATGDVIAGDKFIIQQAQQVWAFSWLYNTLDGQPTWLQHAQHGATFLSQFAHSDTLTCYAQVDRRGRPTVASSDFLPDSIAVMAYVQLHRATGNDEWAMLAKQLFTHLYRQRETLQTEQAATLGGFRQVRQLHESITLLKAILELQPLLDEETWKQHIDASLSEILHEFVDRRTDTLREFILTDGAFLNTHEGRRINVGLTFQTANYLLDFYNSNVLTRTGILSASYRKLAVQVRYWCTNLCEQAWDETNGGLNQFSDFKQQPLLFPDWQQKWAWVQVEALAALIKCHLYTRHPDCLRWFKRIHDYLFQHFSDPNHTGWQLAVDQTGQPLLSAKSIPTVGCYSLIRCLAETAQLLQKCEQEQTNERRTRVSHP